MPQVPAGATYADVDANSVKGCEDGFVSPDTDAPTGACQVQDEAAIIDHEERAPPWEWSAV